MFSMQSKKKEKGDIFFLDSGVSTSKITIDLTGEHLCLKVVEGNNIEL